MEKEKKGKRPDMRIIAVLTILLLLPVLAGCNVILTSNHEITENYAFVFPAEDVFQQQMIDGLQAGISDYQLDLAINELDINEPGSMDLIRKAVRRSTRAIIITSFRSKELDEQLEKAYKKGISLIYLDAAEPYSVPGTYIDFDEEAVAEKAGELLGQAMGYKGQAVMLNTASDDPKGILLENGFQNALQKNPNIRLINIFSCNNRYDTKNTLQDILAAHPEVDGIFAASPVSSAAVVTTLEKWDRDIQVIGLDYTDETLESLEKKEIYGYVSQNPYGMGYEAAKTVQNILKNEEVLERIKVAYDLKTIK